MVHSPSIGSALQPELKVFNWSQWVWVAIPVFLYIGLRFPALLHQPGGQDEQFFSVPGLTVLREGIPRIPYLATRNRATFFENADRCLMAIPPALFYVQAPFFAIFPAGYPTSRLPSFVGALALIVVSYVFARQLGASNLLSLMAATLVAISRPLLFTGIIARPDLLCILCGMVAMLTLFRSRNWDRGPLALAVGALCGLAALFHPLALVFGIQAAVAFGCAGGSVRQRLRRVILFGGASLAVLCLWLPLILAYPYEFSSQFFANVFDRAGPGLITRLVWPFASLQHHAMRFLELTGPWQLGLLVVALLFSSYVSFRYTECRTLRGMTLLAWSSIYLTATVVGIHPTLGYWLYASVLIVVLFAAALQIVELRVPQLAAVWMIAIVLCLPGAGLRSSWTYLRHFGDREYHAPKFIAHVLGDLPQDGLFVVDLSYVFDVYLSGRATMLCAEKLLFWGEAEIPYSHLMLAWEGSDAQAARHYAASCSRLIGEKTRPQSCYVEIYERACEE